MKTSFFPSGRNCARSVLFPVSLLLFCTPTPAQIIGGEWGERLLLHGEADTQNFGSAITNVGDLNLDGYPDYVVGSSGDSRGAGLGGSVTAYSGRTGNILWLKLGQQALMGLGDSTALAGDVNMDGVPDVVAGGPGYVNSIGTAVVISGADGSEIWRVSGAFASRFGDAVDGNIDLNQDGYPEFFVGAPEAQVGSLFEVGEVRIFSGANGQLLHTLQGTQDYGNFGGSMATFSSINGDNVDDFAIGAPAADVGSEVGVGEIHLYSGADYSTIHVLTGDQAVDQFGFSLSVHQDANNDFLPDLVVGSIRDKGNSNMEVGSVSIISLPSGNKLWEAFGNGFFDYYGHSVSVLDDVDSDGLQEVVAGAPGFGAFGVLKEGYAKIHSGANGTVMAAFYGTEERGGVGWAVSGIGDANNDGFPAAAIGAPGVEAGAGEVTIQSFFPGLTLDSAEMSASANVSVKGQLEFLADEAGRPYALLASASGTGPTNQNGILLPLTQDSVFALMTQGNAPANISGAYGTLDAQARANFTILPDPILQSQIGRTFHLAAVSYNSGTSTVRWSSIARPLIITP